LTAAYYDPSGRRVTLEEAMTRSQAFMALVSKSYLIDIRNRDPRITSEIKRAEDYRTPTFLFFFEDLSGDEKNEAVRIFANHNVIKTYDDMPKRPGLELDHRLHSILPEIRKILKEIYR